MADGCPAVRLDAGKKTLESGIQAGDVGGTGCAHESPERAACADMIEETLLRRGEHKGEVSKGESKSDRDAGDELGSRGETIQSPLDKTPEVAEPYGEGAGGCPRPSRQRLT